MEVVPMAPQNKKRRAAAAATLPDDVVLEILSRVAANDVALLFRCTVASKRWLALVADPSFLRRRWPDSARDPSSFLGLFGRQEGSRGAWISGPPTFVPVMPSPLGPFPGPFGPRTASLLDNAKPLVSCHGVLLVELSPRDLEDKGLHLALYNMFSGTCGLLPPLKCEFFGIKGSAILADSDYCSKEQWSLSSSGYSSKFKVLVMVEERGTLKFHHNLYSFESSWSKPFELIESTNLHSNIVVWRGKVHWLLRDICLIWNLYTFEVSNETIHVCLTKISIPHGEFESNYYNRPRLYVTMDGNLSLLILHTKCCKLDIWTYQGEKESGGCSADWLRSKVIELKPKMSLINEMACMCLCQRSGTVLILDQYSHMHIVNLETGVVEKFPNQFRSLTKCNLMPFEMDWPAFFVSRLEAETEGIKPE